MEGLVVDYLDNRDGMTNDGKRSGMKWFDVGIPAVNTRTKVLWKYLLEIWVKTS
jgi:hypothetical protein